jgi:hypothetical protein
MMMTLPYLGFSKLPSLPPRSSEVAVDARRVIDLWFAQEDSTEADGASLGTIER